MAELAVENLVVAHGRVEALHGVSLTARAGRVTALIGANGAGKTTLLRAACGLLRSGAGRVRLDGQDITNRPPHAIAAMGVAHVLEGRHVFPDLTVAENLTLGGWPRAAREDPSRRAAILDRFPRLAERSRQRAGSLSGGEQQMLAIGRALMGAPKLLLLDEPSMGLAPLVEDEIFATLAQLRREGATILLVEQNASAALDLADDAYVLETGRVTLSGPASELARNPRVIGAYLGG